VVDANRRLPSSSDLVAVVAVLCAGVVDDPFGEGRAGVGAEGLAAEVRVVSLGELPGLFDEVGVEVFVVGVARSPDEVGGVAFDVVDVVEGFPSSFEGDAGGAVEHGRRIVRGSVGARVIAVRPRALSRSGRRSPQSYPQFPQPLLLPRLLLGSYLLLLLGRNRSRTCSVSVLEPF
jgi:hypothetical protein